MFFPASDAALREAEYRIRASAQKAVELVGSYSSFGIEQATFVYILENFERLPAGFFPLKENLSIPVSPGDLMDAKADRHADPMKENSVIATEFAGAFNKDDEVQVEPPTPTPFHEKDHAGV